MPSFELIEIECRYCNQITKIPADDPNICDKCFRRLKKFLKERDYFGAMIENNKQMHSK